jgi:hypothetical protein
LFGNNFAVAFSPPFIGVPPNAFKSGAFLGDSSSRATTTTTNSKGTRQPSPCLKMLATTKSPDAPGLYGIPGGRWTSRNWNWESAMGSGHDCALICRRNFDTTKSRQELVESLLSSKGLGHDGDFDEVRLVLALTWQRGSRDGSDGGDGGYGEVLQEMAEAKTYDEPKNEVQNIKLLIVDMASRFPFISSDNDENTEQMEQWAMEAMGATNLIELQKLRLKCCGMVLQAMGFVESGI